MKSLIIAAGVLALSGAAAIAQPLAAQVDDGYAAAPVGVETYGKPAFGERSLPTSYQAIDAGSVAPGFGAQNDTQAKDVTPNMGAGTSQSSNANNG
jgi:hypothetical protein